MWDEFIMNGYINSYKVNDKKGHTTMTNFPTIQNGLEKRKKLYLIKLVSYNEKEESEKGIQASFFFIFGIWNCC